MKLTKREKTIFQAPGRICLFGDHQDYLGLPVIACAINKHINLIAEENDIKVLHIKKPDIGKERHIPINQNIEHVNKGDYILSALKVLKNYGCVPDRGYTITISGNLSINSGMSSSSAVVVVWIKFLLETFGATHSITPEFLSQIAYEAEVLEHGEPGGKMDQYSIGMGNILYLETGDVPKYQLINKSISGLIIGESGVPKDTIGVLKGLKEKTWEAIDMIKAKDKTFILNQAKKKDILKYLNQIPPEFHPYLHAAIFNHDITQRGLKAFQKECLDFEEIGKLMNEHHQILSDYLKNNYS